MDAQFDAGRNHPLTRGSRALARAASGFCAIALAMGLSGGAGAQETAMPYGSHDGYAGVVTTPEECAVYGWAVDPDDLDRDVTIHVFSDGVYVTSAVAWDFGQDMYDLGICAEGTCRFTINLSSLIAPDVAHSIRIQAWDQETDENVDLEGTPLSLECETTPPPPAPGGLRAFPDQDRVDGDGWWTGEPVYLQVDEHEYVDSDVIDGHVEFALADHDLVQGDQLTMSSAGAVMSYRVKDLYVTDVNPDAQTVSGSVNIETEGEQVHVFVGQSPQRYLPADISSGVWEWTADFSADPVLAPGVCGNAEAWGVGGGSTIVDWCVPAPPPNPWFTAFPEGEIVEGWDWPLNAIVHLSIDDPATEMSPDFEQDATVTHTPWGSGQLWVWFEFPGSYDMKPGDIVTLTHGDTERTHVVQDLSITHARAENNSVAGTAAASVNVNLWSWEDPEGGRLLARADSMGEWEANFDDVGFDLLPGHHVRAEVWVDGNDTAVDRYVPNPHFNVFPEWDALELWEWPDGTVVQVTIDDPDTRKPQDFKGSFKIQADEGDPSFHAWINLGDTYDVQPGDVITLKGKTGTRTHTVRHLAIMSADAEADTVAGTAEVGATVFTWPYGYDQYGLQLVAVGGTWLADFGALGFELVPWTSGQAEIRDEAGNATAVDWSVHPPRIAAYPDQNFIIGWDWPREEDVTLTIDDPATEMLPDFEDSTSLECAFFDPSCNTWWAMFDDLGGYDLKTGDIVVLTNGTTTRQHEVLPLTIKGVDGDADIVTGTSAPEAWVYVHPWGASFGPIQADGDGNWLMTFSDLYDLVPGETNGVSEVFEDDADSTAIDWYVKESPTRYWYGGFIGDLPMSFWSEGSHTYKFRFEYSVPYDMVYPGEETLTNLLVSSSYEPQADLVLLRWGRQQAKVGGGCSNVDGINPSQPTRFYSGWRTDELMTYDEAVAHFASIVATAMWDEGAGSLSLMYNEIFPDGSVPADYACSFTSPQN